MISVRKNENVRHNIDTIRHVLSLYQLNTVLNDGVILATADLLTFDLLTFTRNSNAPRCIAHHDREREEMLF